MIKPHELIGAWDGDQRQVIEEYKEILYRDEQSWNKKTSRKFGKTTICAAIAEFHATRSNFRICVLDLDQDEEKDWTNGIGNYLKNYPSLKEVSDTEFTNPTTKSSIYINPPLCEETIYDVMIIDNRCPPEYERMKSKYRVQLQSPVTQSRYDPDSK